MVNRKRKVRRVKPAKGAKWRDLAAASLGALRNAFAFFALKSIRKVKKTRHCVLDLQKTQSSQSEARKGRRGFGNDLALRGRIGEADGKHLAPHAAKRNVGCRTAKTTAERVKHAPDLVGGRPPPRMSYELKPRLESRGNSGPSPNRTAFRQSLFSSVCRRAAKLCFAVVRIKSLWRLSRRGVLRIGSEKRSFSARRRNARTRPRF